LLTLAIGALGVEVAQRWRTVLHYRQSRVTLPAADGKLQVDDTELRLTQRAIGAVEIFPGTEPGTLGIQGWSIDPPTAAIDHGIAFYDGLPAAVFWPGRATPALHATTSKADLDTLFAGFESRIPCPPPCRPEAVRVVVLTPDGEASTIETSQTDLRFAIGPTVRQ
ncbi:MAG: hypothetical protein AAF657_31355, partial [Acidobacteriota bacterium]